ncbi:MAG: carboxypeptidase-like regulatory domain-containing protein, partial [Candidatus Micrarchaeota archaeon]
MGALGKFYSSLEDHYYAFCDSLEDAGVKIYEWFVNPIEDHGIPSFPVFILLLALIVGGAAFLLTGFSFGPSSVDVEITVLSESKPVNGAQVTLELEDGTEFTELTRSGMVLFKGLPKDASATLRVKHTSGTYDDTVVLSGEPITVLLRKSAAQEKSFKIVVASTNGNPVAGARISFSDPDSNSPQQLVTDANGEVLILYSNEGSLYRLQVSAENFKTELKTCTPVQKSCSVFLTSKSVSLQSEVKGNIVVYVKNSRGQGVENAFVTLYDAGGSSQKIAVGYTDEDGVVYFQESAAAGKEVYVNVEQDDYLTYRGVAEEEIKAVQSDRNTEFNIVLRDKGPAGALPVDYAKLLVTVKDEDNTTVKDAVVKLFAVSSPLRVLGEKTTNVQGKVEFEVSRTILFYATVYAEGFIPERTRQMRSGEQTTVFLEKIVVGSTGELEVLVKNADGNSIQAANVELISDDGFSLGYPAEETGADGLARFVGVEADVNMVAFGISGSQNGSSALFSVSPGSTKRVDVVLQRTFARILARAWDVSQSDVFINATITAFDGNTPIVSCTSPTDGSYCTLDVYSNKPIVLKASAEGFANFQSESITIPTGQEIAKTLSMLPSDLSGDVVVMGFTLEKMDSQGRTVVSQTPANSLERGGWYKANLVVNFPEAEKKGFYLRVGSGEAIAEDKAFISRFDLPNADENAQIDFGSTFNLQNSCDEEAVQQSGGEIKWVSFEYAEEQVGVKTLSAVIRIRPSASQTENVVFDYRAWAVKNGLWARVPEDSDLGTNEDSRTKESCHAETITVQYPVTQGFEVCGADGCISLALKAGDIAQSRFLSVTYDT